MTAPQFFSFVLCIAVYSWIAMITTGSLVVPITIVKVVTGPIGAGGGNYAVLFSTIFSAVVAFCLMPFRLAFRWPVFVALCMILNVSLIGIYADWRRNDTIIRFSPDKQFQHSFSWSLLHGFSDSSFQPHAAVLRDCVPYIWSYRSMRLFRLEPNIAVNVLPYDWIKECGIKQTPRP